MTGGRQRWDAVKATFREVDETPVLNTYVQTSPETGETSPEVDGPKSVLIQPDESIDEELAELLAQARALAKAQGRELTEVEASFIGVGSALNSMMAVVQHVQEQILGLAAKHAAFEKRIDGAIDQLMKSR